MSATISLYTIAKDVHWISGPYFDYEVVPEDLYEQSTELYNTVCKQADDKFGTAYSDAKDTWINETFNAIDPLYLGQFSDEKDHETLELTYLDEQYENMIRTYFNNNIHNGYGKYDRTPFLILNTIMYRQGWFFKKSFLNSRHTIRYACTKDTAYKLLSKVLKTYDVNGREAYYSFITKINTLNDGEFILEIAF